MKNLPIIPRFWKIDTEPKPDYTDTAGRAVMTSIRLAEYIADQGCGMCPALRTCPNKNDASMIGTECVAVIRSWAC